MVTGDPVDALLGLPRFGAGLGLHRIVEALGPLAPAWMERQDAIKVTGSNGKGSTCLMVAAILRALGVRVGLFTSPHLRRLHERIVIDGAPIDHDALVRATAWVREREAELRRRNPQDRLGAFEALTLAAMHRFAAAEVDVVVAEAGIGGRYDPTRVIPGRTCGLVSVDLEHTALLGSTLEAIAFDKADLCPSGGELVAGPLDPDLARRLEAYCGLRSVTLCRAEREVQCRIVHEHADATVVDVRGHGLSLDGLRIGVPGLHQVDNARVAVRLVQRWSARRRPDVTPDRLAEAIRQALGTLRLPGRLERIHQDPPVLVDVGHNAAAMRQLARALPSRLEGAPLLLLAGVSHDRDPQILAPLLPRSTEVWCTRAHHRGGDPQRIRSVVEQHRPPLPSRVVPTIDQALRSAIDHARGRGMTVLVTGGLFVAMEAAAVLDGDDPRRLRYL